MKTRQTVARLTRMDRAELLWRAGAAARIALDRARTAIRRPRWNRDRLDARLAIHDSLDGIHRALRERRWMDAHCGLSQHFANAPPRFPLSRSVERALAGVIHERFPDSARHAARRADRVVSGKLDVLGYRRLRFADGQAASALPDWHFDPVHNRRVPRHFWSTIDYLDPECGDHKIIWELNRHQHWIALGRAYWLTGDARYRARFRVELASWLDANPPLFGINWASMLELGLRSLSWLWALHFFVDSTSRDGNEHSRDEEPWTVDLLVGLDRQLTQVERNLSRYFSPNTHLLGEGLTLYVAGRSLPELADSRRWERIGRQVLVSEVDRQIARDGGHRERSAHYHRYALDFYILALIVSRLTRDAAAARFEEAVARLAAAARLLADNRGKLPHVGDDDGGSLFPIAGRPSDDIRDTLAVAAELLGRPDLALGPPPEEALWMLGTLDSRLQAGIPHSTFHIPHSEVHVPSAALPETGYCVSRSKAGDHLLIDGGPHGYQNGGHAHSDALSLTLTVRGVPLLVDPGTCCYTTNRRTRDRFRSSASHNTLTLDDRSQSIARGPFHWSHIANGNVHCWRTNPHFDYFHGSHDGYLPAEHRRHVLALHGDLLVVGDLIDAAGPHAAAVHWHVHPDWRVEIRNRVVAFIRERGAGGAGHDDQPVDDSLDTITFAVSGGIIETFHGDQKTGLGFYSPVYGQLAELTTIRITRTAGGPFWMACAFDLSGRNAVERVDLLPVWSSPGTLAHATAVRIDRAGSADHVVFIDPAGQRPATNAVERTVGSAQTWRAGDIEADARMLVYRLDAVGRLTRLGLVDGSVVRTTAGRVHVALATPVSDLHVDLDKSSSVEAPHAVCSRVESL